MSLTSEIHAEHEANKLEKVLRAALDSGHEDVIQFCYLHVAPLYWTAREKAFGMPNKPPADIYHRFCTVETR